jgi:XTP/dITP diphosphohydrolase
VIGEDSGICVDALGGKPGIYSARFAGDLATDEQNNQKLIEQLQGESKRSAHYVSHVALSDPQGRIVLNSEERCYGKIIDKPRGDAGFGYDPYFLVLEYDLTMAELGNQVKSLISHRAKAMRRFFHNFFSPIPD